MSSRIALVTLPVRAAAAFRASSTSTAQKFVLPRSAARPLESVRQPVFVQPIRCNSNVASNAKLYDFAQIKQISAKPSKEQILIDVREPAEFTEGYIPTAINIPVKSQPDAFFLPEDEFEDRFGFVKPPTDAEVIFYCRSGVRSNAAAQLARQYGYSNVAEYRGSWLDWSKNGGETAKP